MSTSRRSFLKSVGAAAAALPFFRLLENSAVEAASVAPPLRFITFTDPHSTLFDYWRPQAPGGGAAGETNFTLDFTTADGLGSILSPFQSIIDKCLVLDGLCVAPQTQWEGHAGYASLLTGLSGMPAVGNKMPVTLPSIDQYLANQLGGATQIRSVAFSNGEDNDYKPVMSYDMTSSPVPQQSNPYRIYNYLFGNYSPPSGTTGGTSSGSTGSSAQQQSIARQKSQLDYIQADLQRLNSRLAPTEQLKLQEHLQAIRDIENQLQNIGSGGPTTSCSPTTSAPNIPWTPESALQQAGDLSQSGLDTTPVDGLIRSSICNQLAQAFACDITRFATFQLAATDDTRQMPYVANPAGTPSGVQGSLLATNNLSNGDCHVTVHSWNTLPYGKPQMWMIHNYYANLVADFAKALDAIPEGDGTVLDHTCILWIGSMGDGWDHINSNVPCMLIGGANGYFKTGRYLTCGPLSTSSNTSIATTAHNPLLVSILNAFGMDLSSSNYGSSALSGLTG